MTIYPLIDLDNKELTDKDNKKHQLHPHEFWYMAPRREILLHNAVCGQGIVLAMDDLLKGIPIKPNKKTPEAIKAEEIFEEIRLKYYPNRPSRLRCHFLSLSKEVAEKRLKEWKWENKRILTKCYLILSSGKYHFANINLYEKSAKENNENLIKQYARSYWEGFTEADAGDEKIELLADSALYFPDWNNFPKIELANLSLHKELERKIEIFNDKGFWEQYIPKI